MRDGGSWPEGRALVSVRGLTCVHRLGEPGEVIALEQVDLELAPGELVALVGPGGSGKTTLLRVLAGLVPPDAGQVLVGGLDLATAAAAERDDYRRRLVGYVAQRPAAGLWPSLTVADNVRAPMLVTAVAAEERSRRAGDLLEALGLTGRLRQRPAQLPGGERLRLALAVALANVPALLLVDEPAGEVDADAAWAILADLDVLVRRLGTATLVATWNPDAVATADRVVWLQGSPPAVLPTVVGRA
jgi:ABC-type lipoprotein export system ATPase subunit